MPSLTPTAANPTSPHILRSKTGRNILVLLTGTGLGQLLMAASVPLLVRFYSQEAFGVMGVYIGVVNTLGACVTGKYEMALPIAATTAKAGHLLVVACVSTFVLSALSLLPILAWPARLAVLCGNASIAGYLWLVPAGTALIGLQQALAYWLNRKKAFSAISRSRVAKACMYIAAALLLGGLGCDNYGLLFASVCGSVAAVAALAFALFPADLHLARSLSWKGCWAEAKAHAEFPKYYASTSVIDTLANSAPVFFISAGYGAAAAGAYTLANGLLSVPVGVASDSIGQVLFQNLGELRAQHQSIRRIVSRTALTLGVVTCVATAAVVLLPTGLLVLLFGKKWAAPGEFLRILAVAHGVRFLATTLSVVLPAAGYLLANGLWKIAYGAVTTIALAWARALPITSFLSVFVLSQVVCYAAYLVIIFRAAARPRPAGGQPPLAPGQPA
jgi:O-antigen/teichoic acid export membrane protein